MIAKDCVHVHFHMYPFPPCTVVEPTITTQPMDALNVPPNRLVSFTVVANGDPPSYQWFMINNEGVAVLIEGANQSSYVIANVGEQHEGNYFCEVSNDAGSVNSTAAILMLCKFIQREGGGGERERVS